MKILVTGASGFIGFQLTKNLCSSEHEVYCLVRKTSNISKLNPLNVKLITGDLTDIQSLDVIPDDIELVFHLAAYVDFSAISESSVAKMISQNVDASENLFNVVISKTKQLKKFIFFSSLAAMGFQRGVTVDNNTKPEPDTIYGKSKYFAEQKLEKLSVDHNVPLVIIRPSLVYGTGDKTSDFLNSCRMIKRGIFPIFGSGNNIMSPVIYLEDLIKICLRFIDFDVSGKFICCNDEKFTIGEFVKILSLNLGKGRALKIPVFLGLLLIYPIEILCKLLNKPAPLNRRRVKDLSVDRKLSKIHSDLQQAIDYFPKTNLLEGSQKVIAWYKKENLI